MQGLDASDYFVERMWPEGREAGNLSMRSGTGRRRCSSLSWRGRHSPESSSPRTPLAPECAIGSNMRGRARRDVAGATRLMSRRGRRDDNAPAEASSVCSGKSSPARGAGRASGEGQFMETYLRWYAEEAWGLPVPRGRTACETKPRHRSRRGYEVTRCQVRVIIPSIS